MTESNDGNFLRMPHYWIDEAMLNMSPSEWMVVTIILRQTIGWHKNRDSISLSQFQEKTGLSKNTIINAIRSAAKNRWIRVYEQGTRSVYEPSFEDGVATLKTTAGSEIEPELVQKLNRSSSEIEPELVQKLNIQKKEKKKKEKKKKNHIIHDVFEVDSLISSAAENDNSSKSSNSSPDHSVNVNKMVAESEIDTRTAKRRSRKTKHALDEHEAQRHRELFASIASICVLDPKLRSCAGQIARTAKELREADSSATSDAIKEFLEWWKISDWRGRMGKPPTPQQIIQSWKLFRENYAEHPRMNKKQQEENYMDRISRIYSAE